MKKNVLFLGPFCGDWETEISLFRPYIKWISTVINYDEIYVSSHNNRRFIYDWIKEENFIPVYDNLSRDELEQNKITHNDITQKDYFIIQRKIIKELNIKHNKPNLYNYFLNYSNRMNHYPYYKRIYESIKYDVLDSNDIFYIPDLSENNKFHNKLYSKLSNDLNISIIGDMKIDMCENNEILKDINYFEDGYKNIINKISNAKLIICPLSHWTLLSVLQKTPVISWINKKNVKYKSLSNFSDNKKLTILNDTNINNISNYIKSFIGEK